MLCDFTGETKEDDELPRVEINVASLSRDTSASGVAHSHRRLSRLEVALQCSMHVQNAARCE